jgi:hypothetical protein
MDANILVTLALGDATRSYEHHALQIAESQDGEHLTPVDIQIDAFQDFALTVAEGRCTDPNKGCAYCHVAFVRRSRYAK